MIGKRTKQGDSKHTQRLALRSRRIHLLYDDLIISDAEFEDGAWTATAEDEKRSYLLHAVERQYYCGAHNNRILHYLRRN